MVMRIFDIVNTRTVSSQPFERMYIILVFSVDQIDEVVPTCNGYKEKREKEYGKYLDVCKLQRDHHLVLSKSNESL